MVSSIGAVEGEKEGEEKEGEKEGLTRLRSGGNRRWRKEGGQDSTSQHRYAAEEVLQPSLS